MVPRCAPALAVRVPTYQREAAALERQMNEEEKATRDRILDSRTRRSELAMQQRLLQAPLSLLEELSHDLRRDPRIVGLLRIGGELDAEHGADAGVIRPSRELHEPSATIPLAVGRALIAEVFAVVVEIEVVPAR